MMLKLSKTYIKKVFYSLGIEIRKVENYGHSYPRDFMYGCLYQAAKNGLQPKTIVDVGAANGTPALYQIFPEAKHILVEPLEEFSSDLEQIVSQLKKAEYIAAAASNQTGTTVINVHPDLVGSSIYQEEEDSDVNGFDRIVPTVTLDEICTNAVEPFLIKIDAQGAEIDVLTGGLQTLKKTECVILEVSLFNFFKGAPVFDECIDFMKERGFVVYDIFDLKYRLLDGAMSQIDIAFVPEKSELRKFHFYATREQRKKQNQRLKKSVGK
ncbi:FkbM family methyltransferase [Laspinema olomoucense]|uniref:FkbM family methyltransferase n=1 Tax=Laspinema olomoucense D3b TaxID=2953688 RepID=A0ABT2N3Y4_9CYAN|nr:MULTISPECIES: FkbM family methyltransferase [unclassified Laspinema]MCT7977393.1 FkbM family methyltransferase [Laspinema sp. D3b]MCT7986812.1 FkbM family methyltransferase [Laspinema sp. D3a]